ncbi:hypothetical protein [Actinacidiphila paucisporea]|uniref:Uncharacterized protein n=1 Tax=Actinacidiphila paucisporea TaxID=310782 RepID=A0A1M6TFC4_9ACTN|nr:hypothetical protein [Actinacidiphila paucisporea]SHK55468.1 hypothetical protein SAMN05216499_10123 [Actinacidiphila paucisporea]
MTVSTLNFTDATDAVDAGDYMWSEDMLALEGEQADYERRRAEAAGKHRARGYALLCQAAAQPDGPEGDRLRSLASQELRRANDPLPEAKRALERLERIVLESCGQPAVLVRPSLPDHREVYHRDAGCKHISGGGRYLLSCGWTLVGAAREVGYRACSRCGTGLRSTAP